MTKTDEMFSLGLKLATLTEKDVVNINNIIKLLDELNTVKLSGEKVKELVCIEALIKDLYDQEPSLKSEGFQNFDGYFVHWDKIIAVCSQAWPNKKIEYSVSPIELIVEIINERDKFQAENEKLQAELKEAREEMPLPKSWPERLRKRFTRW